MIRHVLQRARAASCVDEVVLATTTLPADDPLEAVASSLGLRTVRGDETDVLSRYRQAAADTGAMTIVRLTGDNPLNQPDVVDEVFSVFESANADYAANVHPRTFPKGLDVEVITAGALVTAAREALDPYEREHVTPYIWRRGCDFALANCSWHEDLSTWWWTVDEPEDIEFPRRVYDQLFADAHSIPSFSEIVEYVRARPELLALCDRRAVDVAPRV
jgi:spore coat polysaccharide biosynthesis protein SpsF (cytidylyltransferase family)